MERHDSQGQLTTRIPKDEGSSQPAAPLACFLSAGRRLPDMATTEPRNAEAGRLQERKHPPERRADKSPQPLRRKTGPRFTLQDLPSGDSSGFDPPACPLRAPRPPRRPGVRPLRRRASARIHCSCPLMLRNSSAAHSSSASIVAASTRSTKLFVSEPLVIGSGINGATFRH